MTGVTNPPVLVLDGRQRVALAVVRSLGKRGIPVIIADSCKKSLAGASRYATAGEPVADPTRSVMGFRADVVSIAERYRCGLVMPLTDASLLPLLAQPWPLACRLAAPAPGAYERASNKLDSAEAAAEAGLSVPEGHPCRSYDELMAAAGEFGWPMVAKPAKSRYLDGDTVRSTSVALLQGAADLERLARAEWLGQIGALVQPFIPGRGAGVFTLWSSRGPVAWFAHNRLREKPPAGGVSVLCESAAVDPALQRSASSLLERLGWFGPAMVEFRVDPAGRHWFMEVNARFWGSLQLAVDCGVDFPWLYYLACLDRATEPVPNYALGRRLRWELGDLDHLLLQFRNKGTARSARDKWRAMSAFLRPGPARGEVGRRDDPMPFINELRAWVRALLTGH